MYHVQIVSQKRTFRFEAPADIRLTMPGWWNSQGRPTPRLFFYVPADTARLAIYTNYVAAGPPRFFDPNGNEIQPDPVDEGHLMMIKVPREHQAKEWSLDRAKCPIGPLEMLNAPNAFALSPESLLIPQNALLGEAN